ncbi:MAG: PL29 family lyase N-terminal domain-containing protein, partial [Alistipes sp.]
MKLIALLLLMAICYGCSDEYDDSELRGRVENLEAWQKTVNSQISALHRLITALEEKDFVTSVTELADKSGYTITFSKSGPITIKHGQKGADAIAPVVGVKQDADGKYYWTLDGDFILSGGGDKIPTTGDKGETGDDGVTPHIGDNGNWWIGTTDTGVKAQG